MGCVKRAKVTSVVVGLLLSTFSATAAFLLRRPLSEDDGIGLRCRLYCQSGYYLQVHMDGTVNGTRDAETRYGILQMLRVTVKLVSIRGVASGSYLCMNRKGKVYTSEKRNSECVFVEEYLETSHYVYSSKKYSRRRKKLYIAINKRGRIKRGRRRNQSCAQFYVRPVDDTRWTDGESSLSQEEPDDSVEDNGQQEWNED